ncbi:UvrD-helicase domain-containing protein [Streptomyces sp. NBC_00555]|uniref:UvrD-helicase domain-containing protein n=1 Tax=Streptomyces sp. NBC_00555 TaxID=2903662 RepID=UPI0022549068|nr:UvrD-helicase domain-containing protein [Streptomyces sp. NBC_00555]MCX5016709.1 UvrD-helicase domain-containing protein [Streptomyces sp. NBC_00555]
MEPTKEQSAAREAFTAGQDLALVAGAGTGKTSTLILMGEATRKKRGLYVAFNRAIADDARRRFGNNVECRTAHSLAFRAVGYLYRERLNASARIPAKHTARLLGITRDLHVSSRTIKVPHQARLVMGMIRKFCYTTDRTVMARHMEPINGLDDPGQEYVARTLLPYAHRAWEDICSPRGELRFEHDHYMKLWAMAEPRLGADFVLLDEAQDTNPVLEEVFLAQDAQRVCVGDPAQQIYGWRNARDVMTGFPAEQLHLTKSFRFGPAIAEVANRWLGHAGSEMRLTGHGSDSLVGPVAHPQAVLCRGNMDAMSEVVAYLDRGIPVALTGGGSALQRTATAALELKAGRRTSHPELFLFSSWGEVQEYAEQDKAGQDLKAIVQLVDTYGPDQIIEAVNRLSPEEKATVTVSTAHKAKGREWASVRIGKGFLAPPVDDHGLQRPLNPSEARLIYVAVTRAGHLLDTEGISWIDGYETTMNTPARDGTVAGRPLIELSLTTQLKYDSSPISRFIATHLPHTQSLIRDCQTHIAKLPHPVQPIDVQHPNWSALGHAIDYRIRLHLGGRLGPAVDAGVRLLEGTRPLRGAADGEPRKALHTAGEQLLATVDAHLAHPGTLDDAALTRLCFVAGFFEDIARTGEIRRFSLLNPATPGTSLDTLTTRVPPYVIDDIDQQMRLARTPFAPFRALPPASRVCGPVFTGSTDIGGADADFILGGCLLDCKATKDPRRLGREEIHQLAGYLLLDYDDQFGITRVGLYLSRQGGLITWQTPDFLRRLGATTPLPQLRADLRHHLHTAARRTR